jgi:hypothetical protein
LAAISPQLEFARATYEALMVEARIRLASMNHLLLDQRGIPPALAREFGALQIRMVCEIIGLACLVAHGDLLERAPKKIRDAYRPGEIFGELEKLNSNFFPTPHKPEKTGSGWHFAEYSGPPCASRGGLIKIWAQCGDILHKGTLKRLLRPNSPQQMMFNEIFGWRDLLNNLLSNHHIATTDRRYVFITQYRDLDQVNVLIGVPIKKPVA